MRSHALLAALAVTAGLCACQRASAPAPAGDELPTLDVTHWTDKTELFMEYPVLVAGRPALFAIHLTSLDDFTPVSAGRARLEFMPDSGGAATTLAGPGPSRPGAFRVEEPPPSAGTYRWALVLDAPGLSDRHELGSITVYPDVKAAAAANAEAPSAEDATAVAYLKEQQWTNAFGTALVQDAEMRAGIRAPANIHPLPGGEAVVAAPAAGRFSADVLPSIGDRVREGQVLGRLEPRLASGADRATLDAEVASARAALEAARAEQERAERLLAERAVPARRLDEARRASGVAEAQLRAAEARLTQRDESLRSGGGAAAGNTFTLRAPIAGRLAEVGVTLGASYDEGAALFRVVRTDRLELEVLVAAADAPAARQLAAVAIEVPGVAGAFEFAPDHTHDSGVIDPVSRALSVQMEIPNPGERLLVGQAVTATIYGRARQRVATVPAAAVLMEAGRPYVFVQAGGERFVRRFIEIASRDGDRVGVRSGLAAGERVVTRGAYEIQLASAASGLPAEGHVH